MLGTVLRDIMVNDVDKIPAVMETNEDTKLEENEI